MGVPMLKKKAELRYRKGSTCETRNCQYCESFVLQGSLPDNPTIREGRCKTLGVKPGRMYRVRSDYTCDAQKTTYKVPAEWRS